MKRFSFPAGQFLLFTFAVVAAGIKNSHPLKFWGSRVGAAEKANVHKGEGLEHSHILPVVTQQKEQHSAGDKREESVLPV